jgi:cytoskeleton protein RodZ
VSGFGDRLRREREMRGISLEEIAESTKIGTRSLRALEDDEFDKLPGGIFNKGFVRAYARFLGLDEEQTVADFDSALKEHQAATGHPQEAPEEEEPESSGTGMTWLLAVALVVVILLAAGWLLLKRQNTIRASAVVPQPTATSPSTPVQQPPASQPSSTVNTGPPAPATPEKSSSSSPGSTSTSATDHSELSKPASSTSSVSAEPAKSARTEQSNANAPIRLEVFAQEDSWLSISADGKNLGQQILAAQKSRTIRAQKEVRLKLGNVGGVQVSFNGRPVDIDGQPKEVKELIFTPEGLRQ